MTKYLENETGYQWYVAVRACRCIVFNYVDRILFHLDQLFEDGSTATAILSIRSVLPIVHMLRQYLIAHLG